MKRDANQLFPSDLYGRIALGLASLVFGPACWFTTIVLLMSARPNDALGWLFLLLAEELFLALSLFFTCGLIWALATPHWLEKLLDAVTKKLAVALTLILMPLSFLAIWALFFAGV